MDEMNTSWRRLSSLPRRDSSRRSRVERNPDPAGKSARATLVHHFRSSVSYSPADVRLNGYEIGYRRFFSSNTSLDFAGFYNHYHGLFDQEITGPFFLENNSAPPHLLLPAQFGNGLLATTKGGEIATEGRHSTDVGAARGIAGSRPCHEATIPTSLDLSKRLQLDLAYRYMGALPAQIVPSYSTGDAQMAWWLSKQLQLALVGRNLLQPHHPEYVGDPGGLVGIRRAVCLKFTWMR